jgi:hypothetical protein
VRSFGGYDYPDDLLNKKDWVKAAYKGGVPMGADLAPNPTGKAVPKIGETIYDGAVGSAGFLCEACDHIGAFRARA